MGKVSSLAPCPLTLEVNIQHQLDSASLERLQAQSGQWASMKANL